MRCDRCGRDLAYITLFEKGKARDLCSRCCDDEMGLDDKGCSRGDLESTAEIKTNDYSAHLSPDAVRSMARATGQDLGEDLPPHTDEPLEYVEPWGVDRFGELEL